MNFKAKELIKKSRYFNYQVAEAIGISEVSFSRWFRKELTQKQYEKIEEAIRNLQEHETLDIAELEV